MKGSTPPPPLAGVRPSGWRFLATARAQLMVAIFSLAIAIASAVSVIGEVSTVNVVLLFCGGFGAGAMLSASIGRWRYDAKDARRRGPPTE